MLGEVFYSFKKTAAVINSVRRQFDRVEWADRYHFTWRLLTPLAAVAPSTTLFFSFWLRSMRPCDFSLAYVLPEIGALSCRRAGQNAGSPPQPVIRLVFFSYRVFNLGCIVLFLSLFLSVYKKMFLFSKTFYVESQWRSTLNFFVN